MAQGAPEVEVLIPTNYYLELSERCPNNEAALYEVCLGEKDESIRLYASHRVLYKYKDAAQTNLEMMRVLSFPKNQGRLWYEDKLYRAQEFMQNPHFASPQSDRIWDIQFKNTEFQFRRRDRVDMRATAHPEFLVFQRADEAALVGLTPAERLTVQETQAFRLNDLMIKDQRDPTGETERPFYKTMKDWSKAFNKNPVIEINETVSGTAAVEGNNQLFSLRNDWLDPNKAAQYPLKTAICVTMYNESLDLFKATMHGIAENVMTFRSNHIEPDNIAVFVLVDGIQFFNPDFLSLIDQMFLCSGPAAEARNPLRVKLNKLFPKGTPVPPDFHWPPHYSQKTCTVLETVYCEALAQGTARVNTFFILKHKNAGKLSSHFWFFRGFCEMMQPKYCMLVDCGTVASPDAIFKMIMAMDYDKDIGGCCGHMGIDNPSVFGVEGAQLFEYKIAHLLDKAMESFFGFIHVLPGAFSGYRWQAIARPEIMNRYLKLVLQPDYTNRISRAGIEPTFAETRRLIRTTRDQREIDVEVDENKKNTFTCREGNMYLAEDRILCLEIYAQPGHAYNLKYIPDAFCKTDVVDSFVQLMNQRRRWINGTWWAFWTVLSESPKVVRSEHCWSILPFILSMVYAAINMALMWFIVSLAYTTFSILCQGLFTDDPNSLWQPGLYLRYFYTFTIILIFFASILYKAKDAEVFFNRASQALGVFHVVTTIMAFSFVYKVIYKEWTGRGDVPEFGTLGWGMVAIIAGHAIPIILNGEIFTILRGTLAFMYYSPSYMNIFIIYSFCNFDDLSWGNRAEGSATAIQEERARSFKNFKVFWVILFGLSNLIVALVLQQLNKDESFRAYFIFVSGWIAVLTLLWKTVFAVIYRFWYDVWTSRRIRDHAKKYAAAGKSFSRGGPNQV